MSKQNSKTAFIAIILTLVASSAPAGADCFEINCPAKCSDVSSDMLTMENVAALQVFSTNDCCGAMKGVCAVAAPASAYVFNVPIVKNPQIGYTIQKWSSLNNLDSACAYAASFQRR